MPDTNEIILTELRELRSDYNTHARETGERLSRLENQMYSVLGNGQPGRIALLERAVEGLKQWRWKMAGVAIAGSAVCVAFGWLMEWVLAR
jgi:hypothetical protein